MTNRYKADLHVHSSRSGVSDHAGIRALRSAESFTDPIELYHAQRARGMDFVTITDHNTLAGSLAIAHLPGTFLGTELDTWFPEDGVRVHVVALGIDERTFSDAYRARSNIHDLVACLREAGVVHYLAHPLYDMSGRMTPESLERMLLLFNVLEGCNGARTARGNGLLRAIAASLTPELMESMAERQGIEPYGETPWHKTLVGGSDDHSGLFPASAYTMAGGDGTPDGFLYAVAAGDCTHEGADGDSRILAHSIYAASFWKIREILRLDESDARKRGLSLLRKGFGRIGRDVPVLEKTLHGVRAMAPGLYKNGDRRGPAWEELVEREIGSLLSSPQGTLGVDAKELNRRLFSVAQQLADEVMSLHLRRLVAPTDRLGLKSRLQDVFAVAMIAFLEIPYYVAWSFQTKDRMLHEQIRAYFLGERRRAVRDKVAILCERPPRSPATAPDTGGDASDQTAGLARTGGRLDIDVTLLTTSPRRPPQETPSGRPSDPLPAALATGDDAVIDFPALAWDTATDGGDPRWVVPSPLAVLDYLDEQGFSALHTDSLGAQGLLAIVAARLLHLPLTAALDGDEVAAQLGPGDLAGRLRRRYLVWFTGRLDEVFVPSRLAALALEAAGVERERVSVMPPAVPDIL